VVLGGSQADSRGNLAFFITAGGEQIVVKGTVWRGAAGVAPVLVSRRNKIHRDTGINRRLDTALVSFKKRAMPSEGNDR
jgi:hypothetical protein